MNSVILENIPITAEVTALSPQYSAEEREEVIDRIKRLIKEQDAVLVAHYYTDSDLQMIAE
ncbi:MAG: quinolinate synthase NadA, partial [Deltaproteobacteria bacterium]|nr:quinolinate synthase NadA [Deltaproteobacteria bacterium]